MPTVRTVTHRLLQAHGLTTIFGNPGSNELPFLQDLPSGIRYVLGLHEGVVVGMADGYAQVTGQPAFVNLHAAAGTGNAMGALTNALTARTPLVVTAGQQVRSAVGMQALLANVDATRLPEPLVTFSAEPLCASDVPRTMSQAIWHARTSSSPVYVSVPYDDWSAEADDAELLTERQVRVGGFPGAQDLGWLCEAVTSAERPVLVLGADLDRAGRFEQAVELAERLDCPVWAAPSLYRLPFPNRHERFRGVLPAGISSISGALSGHDLALVLGGPVFRYHQHEPGPLLPEGLRLLQVTDDVDAATRAPMGDALVADLAPVVDALLAATAARAPSPERRYVPCPPPSTEAAGGGPATAPFPPDVVFATLREALPGDTRYVVESTSTNAAFWNQMDLRHPGSYFWPAAGGLGFGLPAAVGVALGSPDRRVVAVVGDGSASYGITALWTAAAYQVPVTFVVLRNGTYGALRWFADVLRVSGAPGLDIPGIDFVSLAHGYGVHAQHADDLETLAGALAEPPSGPSLVEVDTAVSTPH